MLRNVIARRGWHRCLQPATLTRIHVACEPLYIYIMLILLSYWNLIISRERSNHGLLKKESIFLRMHACRVRLWQLYITTKARVFDNLQEGHRWDDTQNAIWSFSMLLAHVLCGVCVIFVIRSCVAWWWQRKSELILIPYALESLQGIFQPDKYVYVILMCVYICVGPFYVYVHFTYVPTCCSVR